MDYSTICFVIMPFGTKEVTDEKGQKRTVNFDTIYDTIFEPAIRAARLPANEGGGPLDARRTDKDFFSGNISTEMFRYLEYSRVALADLSGLNPNVFYELGVRHRARQAGTPIFRQVDAPIPFDIKQIKAFPYEYAPAERAKESQAMITRVLTESLVENRPDSPVSTALTIQRERFADIEILLKEAENAIRNADWATAIRNYRTALATDPQNNLLHHRLGLILKDDGQWEGALTHFVEAVRIAPTYAEAYREKGIAENKLYHKSGGRPGKPNGIDSLKRAVELNPQDFDALASLGGALKREGRIDEAIDAYERSTEVSNGHSYPLLNALKLRALRSHEFAIDPNRRLQLKRAERSLRTQVKNQPPYNAPWSFFDLAEIRLYEGDQDEFLELASEGTNYAQAWQVGTFCDSLQQLLEGGMEIPGLRQGIDRLREVARTLN
jgi:Flp pilus assembly protein TadD